MAFNFQFNCIITNKLRKKYFASGLLEQRVLCCCCKGKKALHCIGVWVEAYGMHMCVWYGAGLGLICM